MSLILPGSKIYSLTQLVTLAMLFLLLGEQLVRAAGNDNPPHSESNPASADATDRAQRTNNEPAWSELNSAPVSEAVNSINPLQNISGVSQQINQSIGGISGRISQGLGGISGRLGDLINSPVQKAQEIFSNVESTLQAELSQILQGQFGSVLDRRDVGALGVPDPIEAGNRIEQAVSQQPAQITDTNPTLKGKLAKNEWDRQFTRAQAGAVLGQAGQQQMQQENQQTGQAVNATAQEAAAAQKSTVTQDIMRRIAQQNAQQALIQKAIQTETQQTNRAAQAANLNLTNISNHFDEQRKKESFEDSVAARQILEAGAYNSGLWDAWTPQKGGNR